MKNTYNKKTAPVKATYTVRLGGHVWRIRATHLEVLSFLRLMSNALENARRAA